MPPEDQGVCPSENHPVAGRVALFARSGEVLNLTEVREGGALSL